jgi:RHS repeat-associated protein
MLAVQILASAITMRAQTFLSTLRRCLDAVVPAVAFAMLLVLGAGTAWAQTTHQPPPPDTQMPPGTNYQIPPDDPGDPPYDDATGITISAPATMAPGARAYVTVTVPNTGTTTWMAGLTTYPYLIGSKNPENNSTWGLNRVALGSNVYPSGQASFGFWITAPSTPGTYSFSWEMVREGLHWFGEIASTTITVAAPAPVDDAQLVSASVPTTMTAGSYYNVSLTFKNSGNTTWTSPDFLLANPDDSFTFGLNRVNMSTSSVAPGQSTTFNFQVHAPTTASTYAFQWGMVWEHQHRFGPTSTTYITVSAPATPKPTISPSHTAMVAGQSFTMSWSTTNATSLSHVCSASGTGYTVNEALAVSGSRSMTAQAAWVSYPSTCSWTATGPGGTTTVSETLSTTAAPTAKPTISVSRSSLVAGQSFTTTWSTTDATSLTHVCTALGTGYTVNEALAVSGSRALTAQSGWVGYPSSCTWTASGAGGSATYTETMTTVAGVNSSVTYIYTDGLGSPVARTDGTGTVISRTRYEPYGYVASGVQPTIGFTGHVNDVDTGLTYMQQRYYDPVAGRFLSIDPVVTDVNGGNNFNRYAYVGNNPYTHVDPQGMCIEDLCVGEAVLVGRIVWSAYRAYRTIQAVNSAAKAIAAANGQKQPDLDRTKVSNQSQSNNQLGGGSNLPKDPNDLKQNGYSETSHPDAAKAGHRSFENAEKGDKLRFDKGKEGKPGHEGKDHYHRENPDATGKGDAYLDKFGNPVPRGSDASHLYPNQ